MFETKPLAPYYEIFYNFHNLNLKKKNKTNN